MKDQNSESFLELTVRGLKEKTNDYTTDLVKNIFKPGKLLAEYATFTYTQDKFILYLKEHNEFWRKIPEEPSNAQIIGSIVLCVGVSYVAAKAVGKVMDRYYYNKNSHS